MGQPNRTSDFNIPREYTCFDYVCRMVNPDHQKPADIRSKIAGIIEKQGYNSVFEGCTNGQLPELQEGDVVLFRKKGGKFGHATMQKDGKLEGLLIGSASHARGVYADNLEWYVKLTNKEFNKLAPDQVEMDRAKGKEAANDPDAYAFDEYIVYRRNRR